MRILHLNAGNETGGGMQHILSLLKTLNREEFILGVLEQGQMLDKANQLGVQTVYFPNHMRCSVPLLYKIARFIKRNHIQMVHSHGPRANVYANLLKRFVSFQWLVTVHSDPTLDFMNQGIQGRMLSGLNLNAIRHADRVIAISHPFCDHLCETGVHREKIDMVLNGIDFQQNVAKAHLRKQFGFSDHDVLFLIAARLEPVKGHQIALEAMAKLLKTEDHCHLLLAGEGSLTNTLKQASAQLGLQDYVHFLGHRRDLDALYGMADVTLLTSFSESFPLVLLESARAKTPVITTNVGGVPELVYDHTVGWKTTPGNVRELISAMQEVIVYRDQGRLQAMGETFATYASAKFSLEFLAENVYNIYLNMTYKNDRLNRNSMRWNVARK